MRYRLIVGTTLLGFVAGTALFGFVVGAAILSVVAVATTAGAYPLGGGSPGASHASIGIHNSLSSSLSDSGRRDRWNKPFNSAGGDLTSNTTGSGNGGGKGAGHHAVPRRSGHPHKP